MIPNYRRKRNADDAVGTSFQLQTSNRKDVSRQITENLTRIPHVQVIFTPDATVSGGNTVLKSEDLHPFVKYGIPIGAMFLLGLFLYATFSKRWNRKTAMMTISAESMKLNTTTTIDTIAENVSCQITSAENSVLRHIEDHFANTRDTIINDIPIANEEELMLGLKKTIAKQETKLKGNIRNKFERTKTSIIIEAHDEFNSVENITDILKNHGVNKSEPASLLPEDINDKLSKIQSNASGVIRRKLSDSSDALLPTIQQEILHTTDLLNNIMPNNIQDLNKTRSRLKQMEESLTKDVRQIIIRTEENLIRHIKNRLNEIEKISKSEKAIEIYQNDMEVDIKQPGRQSTDVVQNTDEKKSEKSTSDIDNYSEEASNDKKIIKDETIQISEHNLCSKCAAAKNSQESKTTAAIEINEKYDKMEEINLKSENNNTISTEVIIEEFKEDNNREAANITKNDPKSAVGLNEDEILEIPEGDDRRNNYSVREQAENSIKLWLARFKQAVPHLPDNIRASKKYDKLEKSIGQTTTEVGIEATGNNHVVINMEEEGNKVEHQDDIHKENHSTDNQDLSFSKNETTEVEIHQHPAELIDKRLEPITSYPTTLLDIDNGFLEAGGLQKIEESNSIRAQHKQAEENATNKSENPEKEKIIKIIISEHFSDDEIEENKNKLDFPEKLLNTDDKLLGSDGSNIVEEQGPHVQLFSKPRENTENYESLKSEIEERNIETKRYENEPKVPEEEKEISKMKSYDPSTLGEKEEIKTRTNQAEENATKYDQFKSELEKKENLEVAEDVKDLRQESNGGRNTDVEKKEYENSAETPRKWLKIDEALEEIKVLVNSVAEETKPKTMIESEDAETAKAHNIYQKEWPVSEEDMIKSDLPHEEIIKICQSFENKNVESVKKEEKSDKNEFEEINENEEICPDQYISNHNTLKENLDGNVGGGEYQQNKEVDEAVKSKIFYGGRINETNEQLEEKETPEQTKKNLENYDKRYDEKKDSNTMELVSNNEKEQKEEENWEFNKNVDRKESLASTNSDVSTSSNESTSNEELKKEERDTLATLKLPNMDDKLRKKRRINRRQLKSLDSGVHHYYGEYIAIEFPINETDEVENKLQPKEGIEQSTVREKPQFISTNHENARRYNGINSIQPEDGHTSERGNVAF